MARNVPLRESIPGEVIDGIIARVRNEGGVAVSALRLGKLSGRAHAELLSALARADLEHTGKAIRMPVRQQVLAAVERAGAAGLPTKALAREVRGARSSAEVELGIRELVAEGKLVIAADGRSQRAAAPGPQWLSEAELGAVAEIAQALTALVKGTRATKGKPRPTIARGVLEAPLLALQTLAGRVETSPVSAALQAALEAAPTSAGLVRVPEVVRALEQDHARPALLDALERMAVEGALELRPESAIAGLSDEDRARCPVGFDGTPLSFARLLTGGRA